MNLDRLKGSGLLLDGLNDFLGSWFDVESNCNEPSYTDGERSLISCLPNEIGQLYEIANRWPQLGIGHEYAVDLHDWIFEGSPTHYCTSWFEKEYDQRFACLAHYSPVWQHSSSVALGIDERFKGKIFEGGEESPNPEEWAQIDLPLDELIVTLVLMNITHMFYQTTSLEVEFDKSQLKQENLIFTGTDPHNSVREFYFYPQKDLIVLASGIAFSMIYGCRKLDIFDNSSAENPSG